VNTLNLENGVDQLDSPRALAAWLSKVDLLAPTARATSADVEGTIALREALRALLIANNGGPVDQEAISVLDDASRSSGLSVRFVQGGAELVPKALGVPGAVGRILAIVAAAMATGAWDRLKACRAESCRWAFYDHAKNRSRTWCSMSVCGNRTKVKSYRQRTRIGKASR
jgi:predicted RNA-binding Zn ribbon-like protein